MPAAPTLRHIAFSIAACGLLGTSLSAQAQSSVSISGIADVAVRSVSNDGAGSIKSLVSGSNSTSRLIFSGREDLGGGLGAGFHLEHGILIDVGTPASSAKFFDRRSTVSLFSDSLGELRLGRDFIPSYTSWTRYDPFSYVGVARSANFVSATPTGPIRSTFGSSGNTTVRSDNALQWLLPAGLGGLEGGLMVAPGEGGLASAGLAKLLALRLGYATKNWGVSAATTSSQNSLTNAGKFTDNTIGGNLGLDSVKLTAAWREFKYSSSSQTMWMLGASASFGLHEVKASWIKSDMKGKVGATAIDTNDATQWALGYVYNLSKRSALYASLAQIDNSGTARYLISDGPATVNAGGHSRGYEVGVRHRF